MSSHRPRPAAAASFPARLPEWLVCAGLVLAVLFVFRHAVSFGFTNYDDGEYVAGNQVVRGGLSWSGAQWAFTTTEQANWHPLTWLSLMLDVTLWGPRPQALHWMSVLLHCANTVLVYLAFRRATGAAGPSAFTAALFGVHPLHVESVAWIAERKDVLSTLFWFLTLHAWISWTRTPTLGRRLLVSVSFALGLLSKPMLVTLPVILILFDGWPLGRGREAGLRRLVAEKLDLFILSAISSAVTVYAQRAGGALGTLDLYPVTARIANALVSIATYLGKTIWPTGLAAFYPHPGTGLAPAFIVLSSIAIGATSAAVLRLRASRPYLAFGWGWYLVSLLPVLGIVQVGLQSMADRYTYVPLVGVFVIVAWGARDLATAALPRLEARRRTVLLASCAGLVVLALAAAATRQTRFWSDGITLFERAIAVTGDNAIAQNNLGSAYYHRAGPGDFERAIEHYDEAARINPRYHVALNNLAGTLLKVGRTEEAIERWRQALTVKPDYMAAACNLAGALLRTGKVDEAASYCLVAIAANANAACGHYNLGMARIRQNRLGDAEAAFREAVRVDPGAVDSRLNLGAVLARTNRVDEAVALWNEVLRLDPSNALAKANLAKAAAGQLGAPGGGDPSAGPPGGRP